MKKIFLSVLGAALMFGCSTTSKDIITSTETIEPKPVLLKEAKEVITPDWVSAGSGVFQPSNVEGKEVFAGVGLTKYIEASEQVQTKADDDARNNLAQVLADFNKGIIRYHQAVKEPTQSGWISKEKLHTAISHTAVTLLLETEVVDTWTHPTSSDSFSLVQLDLKKVQSALTSGTELNEREKESVKFITKWVFKNMQLQKERQLLFSKLNRAMAMD